MPRRHGMVLTRIVAVCQAGMLFVGSAGAVLGGTYLASGYSGDQSWAVPIALAIATGALSVLATWIVARLPWKIE